VGWGGPPAGPVPGSGGGGGGGGGRRGPPFRRPARPVEDMGEVAGGVRIRKHAACCELSGSHHEEALDTGRAAIIRIMLECVGMALTNKRAAQRDLGSIGACPKLPKGSTGEKGAS